MRYYVYKTTNLVNNKIYIGIHKSINIEKDPYLGSGVLLNRAIEKYGRENFSRKILFEYDNPTDCELKEAELVNEEFIQQETNYNVRTGGAGNVGKNNPFYGKKHSEEHKLFLSKLHTGKIFSEESKQKLRESKVGFVFTEEHKNKISIANSGENHGMYGKTHSDEARRKMSDRKLGQMVGKNNPAAKSVVVDGIAYDTLTAASQATGLSKYKLRKLLKVDL